MLCICRAQTPLLFPRALACVTALLLCLASRAAFHHPFCRV